MAYVGDFEMVAQTGDYTSNPTAGMRRQDYL